MSKTMREMRDELAEDILYSDDTLKLNNHNTDGSKTDFYDVNGCSDVDDLCEHWKLNFFEGNCLKALVGIAKARCGEVRHHGTDASRDAKKLLHYAERINK